MPFPDAETIAGVAARLALWGKRAPKGLARVEFSSDFSRREVDARLRDACAESDFPFYSIELPRNTPAAEVITHLKEKMAPLPHGLVSITGWATAFLPDVDLVDSLRVLNYNRENLAQFPLCQVWWMTRPFTDAVIRNIPDLASWFIVRLTLQENIAAPKAETDEPPVPPASPERQAAARHRSTDLVERFHNALNIGADLLDLSDLANAAAGELADVGLAKEAHFLSEDFIVRLQDSASYRNYLSGALALREKDELRLLQNLADLYRDQGEVHKAEEALEKALKIAERTSGPESDEIALLLNDLASLHKSDARYAEAEPLYKRALAINEKAVGAEHPHTAACLNNLAELYRIQGRYTEAESLFVRALAIDEKSLGPGHQLTAASLNNLALLYDMQGRYAEAEPLYERVLAIAEKVLGLEHPNTAMGLSNLGGYTMHPVNTNRRNHSSGGC